MRKESIVYGYPIYAEITKLDSGWDVGVFGGCNTHIGAVTIVEYDGTVQTVECRGHKESFISKKWAEKLAEVLKDAVCVRCGIHYDNVTSVQLTEIVMICEDLLQDIIQSLKEEK